MKYLQVYWKKRAGTIMLVTVLIIFFNLYYWLLTKDIPIKYYNYFNLLLLVSLLILFFFDFFTSLQAERRKEAGMHSDDVISAELPAFENQDIALHDIEIMKAQLERRSKENRDLQDYVARWCHEIKIPLAAALLMDEKIRDEQLRGELRGQLERINQQVRSMLLGCRLQGDWLDLKIQKTDLRECVNTAVKNNQFFLIQKNFTLDIHMEDHKVYTDPSWLVYILDQLFSNAIKYATEQPCLIIRSEKTEDAVILSVEDHGEGILESDIRRVFEKGFTGSNHHNGKYKSTGMGLYMVSRVAEKLEHEIRIESEAGEYTRVLVVFRRYGGLKKD